MAAKQSALMAVAQHYVINKNWKATDAAKFCGVAVSSIYKSKWYKMFKAEQKAAQQ